MIFSGTRSRTRVITSQQQKHLHRKKNVAGSRVTMSMMSELLQAYVSHDVDILRRDTDIRESDEPQTERTRAELETERETITKSSDRQR